MCMTFSSSGLVSGHLPSPSLVLHYQDPSLSHSSPPSVHSVCYLMWTTWPPSAPPNLSCQVGGREEARELPVGWGSGAQVPSPSGYVLSPGKAEQGLWKIREYEEELSGMRKSFLKWDPRRLHWWCGPGKSLKRGVVVGPRLVSPEAAQLGGWKAELGWDM